MKRETKYLLTKATDSLVISIDHFNRPWDRGRVDAVLIFLDHAFEMLLKAAILHRGGNIQRSKESQTISFDKCLRKALSDGEVKFLTDEQVLQLQALHNLRDAAQHYLIDLSEQHLYIHAQAGLTLFRDLLRVVFKKKLNASLPPRVLPISTTPPTDLATIFEQEAKEVQKLLGPGKRRRTEAMAKLRGLVIVDDAMLGSQIQPTDKDLRQRSEFIKNKNDWHEIFHGVAAIELTASGTGPSLDLRISKKEGVPIRLVPEDTPDANVVAVRKVDSLGFYNLGHNQVAKQLNISSPKTTAVIWHLKIKDTPECFCRITIGKSSFNRYSQQAIKQIREALKTLNIDEVWSAYKNRPRQNNV